MSATRNARPAPEVRGWCPGALRPMLSGDGLVVRVRPPMGRLTPAQAAGVAALAQAHGNGWLDLSSRANLQLRGVDAERHGPLVDSLAALGLVDADPEAEARRNILVAPFWTPGDGTEVLAEALAAALAAAGAPNLPGKFGFALDTGPERVLAGAQADIGITRSGAGLIVHPMGAGVGMSCDHVEAVPQAIALARWFLDTGGAPDGRGRMAGHVARVPLPPGFDAALPPAAPAPGPGLVPLGALVALAFGQMRAGTLSALAGLGALRLTPWRMLLVERAAAMPDLPDLITRAHDPLLRVVACTGAPGCPQGQAPTRPLARALAPRVPPGRILHVSGCAKGCAHPGPADVTLTATPGGFVRILHGSAGDAGPPFDPSSDLPFQDPMADHAPPL